ncbi:serine/threonine-protein kinase [Tamaricihabitans halophyticus]|nr:serine/threonine-protein kinase [Tamaricihabitans halophyticus]
MAENWRLGGYTEVRELGAGASGRVVHAVHDASGTAVAIKYVSPQLLANQAFRDRFRGEARLLAGLTEAHIVRFYEYVEGSAGAAIVMELVDGVSLRELLNSHGAMPPEAALLLLKGSLLGLTAAHAAGAVHRDYKPPNVLVCADGSSKLADFGIAVSTGAVVAAEGSPAYLAPEQWAGAPASPSGDVYSATAVFFECLTGHRPFPQQELSALAAAHRDAPIPLAEVPESLRELVADGLAKDPALRHPSAAAFLGDLELAASAGYGEGWEARGRKRLVALTALLAGLFPLAHAPGALAPGTPEAAGPPAPEPPAPPVSTPPAPPAALGPLAKLPTSVLVGAGAVVTAGAIVGAVVIVGPGSSDELPPRAESELPETPPQRPDDVDDVIVDQVSEATTASFTYDYEACCANVYTGNGRISYGDTGSTAEIVDYYNTERGPDDPDTPRRNGFVFPDMTYMDAGNGWRDFPTGQLDTPAEERAGWADDQLDAAALVEVRNAAGIERVRELLADATLNTARQNADSIIYRGEIPADESKSNPEVQYFDLGTEFTLTLNKDYLPISLAEREKYSLGDGQEYANATTIEYTDWGKGEPISRPR